MINRLSRVLVTLSVLLAAGAIFAGVARADTIVNSFTASSGVEPGRVVAIKPGSSSTAVELSPAGQSQLMYGVVVDPSQAPVTLERDTGQQVFVATSGNYFLLVSTQHGPISPGDYLSISSTDGVAAKATNQQAFIIGQSLQKFDGTSGALSGSGSSAVGLVSANIQMQRNPWLKSSVALPSFLRSVGDSIAGRESSPVRIYAALGVFIVAAAVAFGALTAGIRNAMVAIGRNPLSRHYILNGLVQVVVVAVMILSLGMVGVYLLLRL